MTSPEWLIAVTARQIALRPSAFLLGFLEFLLTGSNLANSLAPCRVGAVEFVWWRLNRYLGLSKEHPCLITDELIAYAVTTATAMWDSTESSISLDALLAKKK